MSQNQIRPVSPEAAKRRLRLRVAAKVMMYLGFAGVAYVFLSALTSGDGEVPTVPSQRVDIADLEPGQAEFLTWQGRPVLVYHRTPADVVNLRTEDARLKDASSERSEQPEFARTDGRSHDLDYFVAISLGTGRGCTVELVPASDEIFQAEPWTGGFKESCSDDRYDFAGRVYDNQYASENLQVPLHTIDGETLILGQ